MLEKLQQRNFSFTVVPNHFFPACHRLLVHKTCQCQLSLVKRTMMIAYNSFWRALHWLPLLGRLTICLQPSPPPRLPLKTDPASSHYHPSFFRQSEERKKTETFVDSVAFFSSWCWKFSFCFVLDQQKYPWANFMSQKLRVKFLLGEFLWTFF